MKTRNPPPNNHLGVSQASTFRFGTQKNNIALEWNDIQSRLDLNNHQILL